MGKENSQPTLFSPVLPSCFLILLGGRVVNFAAGTGQGPDLPNDGIPNDDPPNDDLPNDDPPNDDPPNDDLVGLEFFGPKEKPSNDFVWAPSIFKFAEATVKSGLEPDPRQELLTKYEVKGDQKILGPPKLNKVLIPALKVGSATLKRDEYQCLSQNQVAASLNAFGSAMSTLAKPEVKEGLPPEGILALNQLADGIHLLADHQHRLSLARRAFIKPALSLVGKNVADNAPIDEWLFGTNFADELKHFQAVEKAAKDLVRAPVVAQASSQPTRVKSGNQQRQPNQQNQQQPPKPAGNSRAPATSHNATRRSGAHRSRSRNRKPNSRSQSRRR